MSSLLDSQRKESIHTDVLESNQAQREQLVNANGKSRHPPESALSRDLCHQWTSCSNQLLLGSQPSHPSAYVNTKCHFFLDFTSPKMMDLLLSDPAVPLFDLRESRNFLS